MSDDFLERWLAALVDTPGLTSLALSKARSALLEDSLRAVPVVRGLEGPLDRPAGYAIRSKPGQLSRSPRFRCTRPPFRTYP